MSAWSALEWVPAGVATLAGWRKWAGDETEAVRLAALELLPGLARSIPCSRECGCAHEVVEGPVGRFNAVCACPSRNCADFPVSPAELALWRVNISKLSRRLCQVFDLDSRPAEWGVSGVVQAGAWSSDAVPVLLSVQDSAPAFRLAVNSLAARLRSPFILFAPTSCHLRTTDLEVLRSVGAGFFTLENTVALTAAGGLRPLKPPGELFVHFAPQPRDDSGEDVARTAFALVRQLDSDQPLKPPSILTVFRLFCMEELSAGRIARKFQCSKTTVLRRLDMIRERTGRDPAEFRAFSPQFGKLEDQMKDGRAERISARRMIYDEEEGEGGNDE